MHAEAVRTEIASDRAAEILKSISIPPCPSVVAALIEEARRPEVDFFKLTRLISGDVGLAASMMKTANSPFFGLRNKVQTVQQAVAVLGLKNILNIVTGLALQRVLSPKGVSMERFWDRSNFHAVVCARLARGLPGIPPEDAYTFGLFHDCGIPILMQRFADYKDTLALANRSAKPVPVVESERHGTDHVVVGAMLARNWQLPPLIVHAIRVHHDLDILRHDSDETPSPVRDLAAICLLAEHIVARFLDMPDEAEWLAHGALVLGHLGFDEEELAEVQQDAAEELREIKAARG